VPVLIKALQDQEASKSVHVMAAWTLGNSRRRGSRCGSCPDASIAGSGSIQKCSCYGGMSISKDRKRCSTCSDTSIAGSGFTGSC